ncbi:MAG: NAD-dependent epimerase/dehydratase family protein [Lachnospiraceae bacterium]|nr:NAD-dependent epimerase/dehydratase family protein [Lachnospiraceae bacterium]
MKNTIYLVTGAAGFLGSNICRQLIRRGDHVRAFVLPNDPGTEYLPEGAQAVEGDLTDIRSLEDFFSIPEGTDAVVLHIASIVTVNPDYSQKVMDVNVNGTKNIINQCLKHPEVKKLVYCSSTGAIPEAPRGQAIREVNYFDPSQVVGCYSQSKALATQAVLDAVRDRGLNACVVHPSGIMGPDDFAVGETTGTLIKIINGEMPTGISGSFNLCDVRDLAAGTIAAADKGRTGECYILGNEPVHFKDFAGMVAEESSCKPVKMFLPIWAANMMGHIMEKQAKRNGTKPLMTRFSVYNLARNNNFDSSKARDELGYTTRSYRETIRDEVAWLKKTGKIHSSVQQSFQGKRREDTYEQAKPAMVH